MVTCKLYEVRIWSFQIKYLANNLEKHFGENGVVNSVIVLKPESTNDKHEAIVLSAEDADEMLVVAEFLTVI